MASLGVFWFSGVILFFLSVFPPWLHYSRMRKIDNPHYDRKSPKYELSLTIFLPMKNEGKNVVRKINEVLSMDRPTSDLRLLIVDSGSNDGTADLAKQHLEKIDDEISWRVISLSRSGKSVAVNHALEIIETDIMIMMDADAFSPSDSLVKLYNHFSDKQIGAVCGKFSPPSSILGGEYRKRFNTIRTGESVIWATPILEGSICAFRISSIGDNRINDEINADDSQLSMIIISNGFRTIMDPEIRFNEGGVSQPTRKRLVRRGQGLIRAINQHKGNDFSTKEFKPIFYHSYYFYTIMPLLVSFSIILFISSSISYSINYESDVGNYSILTLALFSLSRTCRDFVVGISILLESQIRLIFGQKLQNWDTDRKS